jgi:hypothetical protein
MTLFRCGYSSAFMQPLSTVSGYLDRLVGAKSLVQPQGLLEYRVGQGAFPIRIHGAVH